MAVCLMLLAATGFLFVTEKLPADVTALSLMAALLLTGLLTPKEAFSSFANEAPLTVAAMFVLSFGLLKTGGFNAIAKFFGKVAGNSERRTIMTMFAIAGPSSAFINNTPVVAVMMPVIMRHARDHLLPVSRLLIPLSYAAILGGMCTLIGTSTNLVVHGIMLDRGLPGFTMFELAKIGLPLLIFGFFYILIFSHKLLPKKETLTTILPPEQRKPRLIQILVSRDSTLSGKSLEDVDWLKIGNPAGVRILELRRRGARYEGDLSEIRLQELDRITLSLSKDWTVETEHGVQLKINDQSESQLGFETLTSVDGRIVEAVLPNNSSWVGRSVRHINPRRLQSLLVLAVHRNGRNLTTDFLDNVLHSGDTLLLLGSSQALESASKEGEEFIFLETPDDEEAVKPVTAPWASPLVIVSLVSVVLCATLNILPISVAALSACLVLMITGVIKPKEAYRSVEWNLIMIICGTMSLGLALSKTGTAAWFAVNTIHWMETIFPAAMLPILMVAFFTILTSCFTEFASNNGTAALMAPLAIEVAIELGVSPMPFVVAVALAASGSFATPIGYQTNTMVYGAGGYAFRDFFRIGAPMNVVTWIVMIVLIPVFWKF